jgi:chromosome segregation ATPase
VSIQEWAAVLTAAGIGGIVVETARAFWHRRGMDANAAKTVTEAAVGLVAPLQKRISELETDLTASERHASDLDTDLKHATAKVIDLMGEVEKLMAELTACRAELRAMRHDMGPHS